LELDRHNIERNDFSAARRGYDPDEVDRHLREIADSIADLKRQQKPAAQASLATAAADQVRTIVEAAERSAAEIQENAEAEAKRITDDASRQARETRERADSDAAKRVSDAEEATQRALDRAGSIESEIDRLLGDLRSAATGLIDRVTSAAGSLQGELDQARGEFASVREARLEPGIAGGSAVDEDDAGPVDAEPEIVAEVEDVEAEAAAADVSDDTVSEPLVAHDEDLELASSNGADTAVEDELAADEEPEEEEEPEPEPATSGGGGGGRSIRGAEGARLIALNMALNGTPRDETARYLEQNFELDDQDALLDEVYARVGG
jgi:DivIVA domain-containing protein